MTSEKEVEAWITRNGRRVVGMMAGPRPGKANLEVTQVSASPHCLVFKVSSGPQTAAVKSFRAENPLSAKAFDREVALLSVMQGTGLAPGILGHDKANGLIVMKWVEGQTLTKALTTETVVGFATKIGVWLNAFSGKMRKVPDDNDWFAYLSNYSALDFGGALAKHRERLEGIRFDRLAIAKNDAFSDNFIVTPDNGLIGIDFEAASMKPVGWDVLLTARVLVKMFPEQADAAIHALIDGWDTDRTGRENWHDLAMIFAHASKNLEPEKPLDSKTELSPKP